MLSSDIDSPKPKDPWWKCFSEKPKDRIPTVSVEIATPSGGVCTVSGDPHMVNSYLEYQARENFYYCGLCKKSEINLDLEKNMFTDALPDGWIDDGKHTICSDCIAIIALVFKKAL